MSCAQPLSPLLLLRFRGRAIGIASIPFVFQLHTLKESLTFPSVNVDDWLKGSYEALLHMPRRLTVLQQLKVPVGHFLLLCYVCLFFQSRTNHPSEHVTIF